MTETPTMDATNRRRMARWHWAFTLVYGLLMVLSLPMALFALKQSPAEGVAETAFFFMNLSVAALPFTIGLSLAAAWIYHRGGVVRASFIPYTFPVLNLLLVVVLRAAL